MSLWERPHLGGPRNVHMMRLIPKSLVVPVRSRSNSVRRLRALLRLADRRQTLQSVERHRS